MGEGGEREREKVYASSGPEVDLREGRSGLALFLTPEQQLDQVRQPRPGGAIVIRA